MLQPVTTRSGRVSRPPARFGHEQPTEARRSETPIQAESETGQSQSATSHGGSVVDAALQGGSDSRTAATDRSLGQSLRMCTSPLREREDRRDVASPNGSNNPTRIRVGGEVEVRRQNVERAGGMEGIAALTPTQYSVSTSPERGIHSNGSVRRETDEGMVGLAGLPLRLPSLTARTTTNPVQTITLTVEEWKELQASREKRARNRERHIEAERVAIARANESSIIEQYKNAPLPSINVGIEKEPFRILGVSEWGSPEYKYGVDPNKHKPLDSFVVRPAPSAEPFTQKLKAPIPPYRFSKPMPSVPAQEEEEQAQSQQTSQTTSAKSWQSMVRPINQLVNTVTNSILKFTSAEARTRHSAPSVVPAPAKTRDAAYGKRAASVEIEEIDEYGDEEVDRLIGEYFTSIAANAVTLKGSDEESKVSMSDRIPAAEKGKAVVHWAPTPIIESQDSEGASVERTIR
jgi:hypothetical protein